MKKATLIFCVFLASCLGLKAENVLEQFAAKYKFATTSAITDLIISIENGQLIANSSLGLSSIDKKTADVFTIPKYNATATFIRNAAKEITSVKIEIKGTVYEGIKEQKEIVELDLPAPIIRSTFPIKNLPIIFLQEAEGLSN